MPAHKSITDPTSEQAMPAHKSIVPSACGSSGEADPLDLDCICLAFSVRGALLHFCLLALPQFAVPKRDKIF